MTAPTAKTCSPGSPCRCSEVCMNRAGKNGCFRYRVPASTQARDVAAASAPQAWSARCQPYTTQRWRPCMSYDLRWDLVISGRPVQRPDVESCNAEVLQLKSVTMTMRLGDESPGKVTSEDPKLIVTILRSERQYTYHYTAVISAAANNLGQRTSVALSRFNSEI